MDEITYICKRTVVSTKPVEAGKYFPLSVLDRHMENNHIRMVYYYPTAPPPETDYKVGEITKNLRNSLAQTLTFFPIMTGRLIRDDKGHWKVKCNDAGVRMVEAKAKGSVRHWLKHVNREKELQLVHWEHMFHKPYFWSTFYVQITEFEEGGIAIGLSFSHLLADTTCGTRFMNAWADISSLNKMSAPPLFYPLPPRRPGNKTPNRQPYLDLINHYRSSVQKPIIAVTEPKYTTISFGFSDEMVRTCMGMAQAPGGPIPSPFEALAGLFWVCLSKIKGMTNNGFADMSICLDARKALGLDHGFFGNCTVYNKVHAGDLGNDNNRLAQAASAIREAVSKMNSEGIMDLIEWFEDSELNCPTMMNGHDVICGNIEEVNPYMTRFEDGLEPIRVSYYVEPVLGEGQVLIMPAPTEEGPSGRVATVTLREDQASKLCEHDLISHLCPTTSMKIR
ncbi:shikimate O-hydroxycinnamoyltransferase [Neltuma alba]|uniref:shikimate O-hydroxycinnamoyltransferase n=1 Tax=Neltuma alba TaxID=207710 RepID=UPI0010A5178B|nr:shikimate O-hydroxycinnamoyltransferase [Prosopis alba]